MARSARRPVVVGVDGSADSHPAVAWAAREAALRACRCGCACLRLASRGRAARSVRLRAAGRCLFERGEEVRRRRRCHGTRRHRVRRGDHRHPGTDPGGRVTARRRRGGRAPCLGSFSGLLIGSVGVGVAAHAACPVVVVRPRTTEQGPSAHRVVVGVDWSPQSEQAVAFAFEEASLRGVGLTAVNRWTAPTSVAPATCCRWCTTSTLSTGGDPVAHRAAQRVERQVPRRRPAAPGRARQSCPHARPRVDRRGARRRRVAGPWRFTGMLLGSVSQALIHHAGCPVAIIR